jgi:hypothetical protein
LVSGGVATVSEINTTLTDEEVAEIAAYTIQKIESYPKEYGKTLENYYDILFPYEVKDFLMRRHINALGEANRLKRLEALA